MVAFLTTQLSFERAADLGVAAQLGGTMDQRRTATGTVCWGRYISLTHNPCLFILSDSTTRSFSLLLAAVLDGT